MFFVLAYPIGIISAKLIIQGLVLDKKRVFVKCISIQNMQDDTIKHPISNMILIMFPKFLYIFLFMVIRLSFGYFFLIISYMVNGISPNMVPIIILIHESCLI